MLGEWTVRDLNVLRGVLGDVTSKDPLMLKLKIKSGIIINKIIRERKKSKKKKLKGYCTFSSNILFYPNPTFK